MLHMRKNHERKYVPLERYVLRRRYVPVASYSRGQVLESLDGR